MSPSTSTSPQRLPPHSRRCVFCPDIVPLALRSRLPPVLISVRSLGSSRPDTRPCHCRQQPPTKIQKGADRRDHTPRAGSTGSDVPQRKVKEKTSWLGIGRNSAGAGQWRPARCKLVEEEEGCLLNIYVDDTILYRSIYMYLLNHTDIRTVHRSLFDRRNCIGVFSVAGQVRGAAPTTEPLYIQFEDEETANTWLALLRSYAMPEVYGRWLSPEDGGLYRMWRQVDLTCLQGRNLGVTRPLAEEPSTADQLDARPDADAIELDVFCELFLNGVLAGRTTVKRGLGSPDWHERFLLADLPPFETLEIVVWREKRLSKPAVVGSVVIVLVNFRRGEAVEGWFPVLHGGQASSTQAGEMRLKIRVDEEIILPYHAYGRLLRTLHSRNHLDWMRELETRLKMKNVNNNIMSIAIAKNVLLENIMELADREVDGTLSSHNTLFRGNTVFTKTVELYMSWYGMPFLEASVGATIRRLCSEKVAIEVDPVRIGKGPKAIEKNVELLVVWCREFWDQIYAARTQCPTELRRLFEHIRRLVENRYRVPEDQNRELPWQSVSAFCFLRFIVPAILHPHLFGLLPGLPDVPIQRSLTLIAKVIQSLANLNPNVQKEEYMRGVKDFLNDSLHAMIDYIVVVSTPEQGNKGTSTPLSPDKHERLRIMNVLRQRSATAPILHREAIPLLPHLLDIPRHLAVVTSVVVRYSRTQHNPGGGGIPTARTGADDRFFSEFCTRCLEVEEQALFRVSKLAAKPRRQHSEPVISPFSPPGVPPLPLNIPLPPSPSFPLKLGVRGRKLSSTSRRERFRKVGRCTAPSSPEGSQESPARRSLGSVGSPPPPPPPTRSSAEPRPLFQSPALPPLAPSTSRRPEIPEERSPRTRPPLAHHPRSTSTDSPLTRKRVPDPLVSPTSDSSVELPDESGKRRRNIFRSILTRR
ncbi:Rho GTPase activation protein [Trametes elegans]|nr:Rho GTPase activation protein [Trametes elegans]